VSIDPNTKADRQLSGDQQPNAGDEVASVMDAIAAFRQTMPRITPSDIRAARDEGRSD
jgi:hypothetical protein